MKWFWRSKCKIMAELTRALSSIENNKLNQPVGMILDAMLAKAFPNLNLATVVE